MAYVQSRIAEFGAGMKATPPSAMNTSPGYQQHSVLDQYIVSANGLGQSDANRRLYGGGLLPTPIGTAKDTYDIRNSYDPQRSV